MGKHLFSHFAYSSSTSSIFISFSLVLISLFATQLASSQDFLHCFSNQTKTPIDKLSGIVVPQGNSSFTSVLNAYIRNARFKSPYTRKPLIIVTPKADLHVQATVICAKIFNVQVKIRSGGHDYDGLSYISQQPFILVDMFNYNKIDVDIQDVNAVVEAGATLGELYYRIWEKSKFLGFPGGICHTMGVGGHISGGGYGNMLRHYGLASDNIMDAKIVDAKGRVLDRKAMGEDLFWAISGGGGASFGVILSYTVRLVNVPGTITVFRIEKTLEQNATDVVYRWQQVAPGISNNLFIRVLLEPITTKDNSRTVRASFLAQHLGESANLMSIMNEEFPELGLKKEDCMEMSWIDSVLWWAGFPKGTNPRVLLDRRQNKGNVYMKTKSDYVQEPITGLQLEGLWRKMISEEKTGLVFNPYGGRMNEIPVSDTPFPHRQGILYKIQYSEIWKEAGGQAEEKYVEEARDVYLYTSDLVSKNPRRTYLNYRDIDIGVAKSWTYDEGKVYGEKYFVENFDRLVKVKTAVDPDNFFRNEQSIPLSI